MNLCQISITLLLIYFLITSTISITSSTHFTGDVSINCGSTRASAARNGRQWVGDMQPKLSPMLQISGKSTTSTPANKLSVDDPVPHKTARISRAPFSYALQVGPGQRIIRLHFNPSSYKSFREYNDLFTVQSGRFTLLSNFSASLTADALAVKTLAKEFCLTIQGNEQLTITFSPETTQSLDTYAFVNGIEIAAVPTALSYFHRGDIGFQVVGEKSVIYDDNDTAFEIIHRHIINHYPISSNGDFDTMFPKWVTQEVDKKSSTSTWNIPVGLGFRYLVRLHFSDVGLKIAGTGELKFTILINEKIAQTNSDILTAGDENDIVLHRDYIVTMRGLKTDGKRDISISILSYDEFRYSHGVVAGFEIVKLSNLDNSLASPNPLPPSKDSPSKSIPCLFSLLGRMNAVASLAIALLSLINIIAYKLRFTWEASSTEEEIRLSDRAERLFRHFSPSEIQLATENFYEGHIIGKGGFGNVYKGIIDNGQIVVAAKRLKPNSSQGAREFLNEIEVLSELQHINLVSLIGYCKEKREMILVYEYMPNGTLGDHLYRNARKNRKYTPLTWKQRLSICIEAGRGLEYLHTGHRLIHRDVKAANILLDENFTAKVSDFGLAKREDRSRLQSHVSTKVKGTYGYFDPYYMKTQRLTTKSDTYAFGVVLFETLCGRPVVDSRVSEDERVLTIWVRDKISKGEVDEIVDSRLREKISPGSLKTFVEVAEKCVHDEPKNRPTMAQVVLQLEFSLEQQENIDSAVSNKAFPSNNDTIPSAETAVQPTEASQVMQTVTYPPAKQINLNDSQAASEKFSRPKKYNLFRFRAWWRPFWRRAKSSDPKEFSSTPTELNLWNFNPQNVAAAANQFTNLCRIFSLHEIKLATCNFDDNLVIGIGGYGKVYRGLIKDGASIVAIKRLSPSSRQGANEFLTEIRVLAQLRHRNLVSLVGYCHQESERILVYDYMAHGSLREHLYGSVITPLRWRERLRICLHVAIGLDYLHTGAEQVIIHRDVKSTNILLDEKWVAKIHDFGLSKLCQSDSNDTHVSTMVKGTFGYLDPEYYRSQKLTVKSDVYAFGVLLLEVLCARQPIIPSLPRAQANLIEWGISCFRKGELDKIIDSNLEGQITPECLNKFAETAIACLRDKCIHRPVMRDVIKSLESAVQLQEGAAIDEDLRLLEFDPSRIAAATNQFSSSNKIGEGKFASIYKAVLPTGRTVAVKRFPSSDSCFNDQYENEFLLASGLDHMNIIKLLGHCLHEERMTLFYEFMENGSLDKFIPEDELGHHQLQWSVRFRVIIGIAKGVIYLHQESRLKIIHRNLNLSNILLDNEMNPKISGFGLARNITDDQSESSTFTVGSLYVGNTSPECITQERISEKVDVYSFGVLVLEILTGKRHNGDTENLIDYAWDLVNDSTHGEVAVEEAVRCIQVGLVCTQRDPQQRPTMYSALKMLIGEDKLLQQNMAQAAQPQLQPSIDANAPNWVTEWPDYDSFNPRAS